MWEKIVNCWYDDDGMNGVLKQFKIRHSWAEIRAMVEDFDNVYKYDNLQMLDMDAIKGFWDVFYYGDTNVTFDQCKAKLIDWISKHKEIYNDDWAVMHARMEEKIAEANEKYGCNFPYINWIPEYGGMIRRYQMAPENKWHKKVKVPFFLDKQTWSEE